MRRGYVGCVSQLTIPTYDDIRRASELVAPHVRRTPVMDIEIGGRRVTLKLELLQHAGSFKVRGAFHSVLSAPERPERLVAASGGNHGMAVAHVGHALGLPTSIFVPSTAPAVKVRAISALGAEVTQVGSTYAEAMAASLEAAAGPGVLALHAYDSFGTVTGQATLGVEIADQLPDVDTVVLAVGGGGLCAGVTRGLVEARPEATVVGVEPETCPTLHTAVERGAPTDVQVGGVAADSLGASRLGDIAYATVREHSTPSLLVSDEQIVDARRWLWRAARVAAEPGGATAVAALLSGTYRQREGERVCVIVCGGNADPADLS
jgi:threonine dehydratase